MTDELLEACLVLEVTMLLSTEASVLSDGKLWELTGVGLEDTTDLT